MRVVHHPFFLCLLLLHVLSFCSADHDRAAYEVVGFGECADCKDNNFKTTQAFQGLHVTVDCKLKTGEIKRVGASELDNQGKFKISLPQDLVQNGKSLKHECYAQLHSAAAIPCPAHNGLSKIAFLSKSDNNKHTFAPAKTLKFSTALCTSKFLWPYYKYPPLTKPKYPWKKNYPKYPLPPLYKYKPTMPPPVYMPKPPVTTPTPALPPPQPPAVTKPMFPPLYKKPCPPLPKFPPKYYFKHPKYGYVPPIPPSTPQP